MSGIGFGNWNNNPTAQAQLNAQRAAAAQAAQARAQWQRQMQQQMQQAQQQAALARQQAIQNQQPGRPPFGNMTNSQYGR